MENNLIAKYPDALMIYDCGEQYGLWLPPISFVLIDKTNLNVVRSLTLLEAVEIIEKSIPLLLEDPDEEGEKPTEVIQDV